MKETMKLVRKTLLLFWLGLTPLAALCESTVDINTANSETLVDELVGIGPQKAMAIVRYRQQHGPFQRIEDLVLVDGIGEKTIEQNRSRLKVAEFDEAEGE
jgi:competence protein ComEA